MLREPHGNDAPGKGPGPHLFNSQPTPCFQPLDPKWPVRLFFRVPFRNEVSPQPPASQDGPEALQALNVQYPLSEVLPASRNTKPCSQPLPTQHAADPTEPLPQEHVHVVGESVACLPPPPLFHPKSSLVAIIDIPVKFLHM